MDTVLSRKLFREKYVEEIKPKKGGIVTLKLAQGGEVFTEGEKLGYLLAPVAASLLQAKQRQGESSLASLFGAVGEGVSQVPAVALNIKKLELAGQKEGKERTIIRNMTEKEIAAEGLAPGTVAQRKILVTSSGALIDQGYDIKKQSEIGKLQDDITKKQIPELDAKLETVFNKFLPYVREGKSIPGIGVGGSLLVPFSKEARENRDSIAGIRNALLKIGAGTAQSKQETENILQELAQGNFRTEEEVINAFNKINDRVNAEKKAIYAGYSDAEVRAFVERSGLGIKESPFSAATAKPVSPTNNVKLEPGLRTYRIDIKNNDVLEVK